jgi:hypothetical protein
LKDIAGRYRARDGDAGLGPLTSSDYFLTSGIAGMFSTFSEPRPLIKA